MLTHLQMHGFFHVLQAVPIGHLFQLRSKAGSLIPSRGDPQEVLQTIDFEGVGVDGLAEPHQSDPFLYRLERKVTTAFTDCMVSAWQGLSVGFRCVCCVWLMSVYLFCSTPIDRVVSEATRKKGKCSPNRQWLVAADSTIYRSYKYWFRNYC